MFEAEYDVIKVVFENHPSGYDVESKLEVNRGSRPLINEYSSKS